MVKSAIASFLFLVLSTSSLICHADDHAHTMLEVIDSFVEMHSGPGRGYPVFYVIEQGEKIEVLTRRPDWYEVRTEQGKVGWTKASQISRTIQTTGEPADLPSVGYGDYIKNSWVTGFSVGRFTAGDIDRYDLVTLNVGYRFLPWLGSDIEFGQTYGADGSGELSAINIQVEPKSQWKFSPYLTVGAGELKYISSPSNVVTKTSSSYNSYALGISYYLGRNFVVKGEYRWFNTSSSDVEKDFETWRLGFNTFY